MRIAAGVAAFALVLSGVIGACLGRRAQQVASAELAAREARGMSKADAYSSVQSLENSKRSANATWQAGALVAGALLNR